MRILAWALGVTGAVACAFTLGATIALGLFSPQDLVYVVFIMNGLLGALVAARNPGNSVGWLMCAASLAGVLLLLPLDYGYTALVVERGAWPFGGLALWLGAWAWAPLLGTFLPVLIVRFPDGKMPPGWNAVDWLAIAGTALFAISLALAPANVLRGFLVLSQAGPYHLLAPYDQNPLGVPLPAGFLDQVRVAGLVVIGLGYVAAAASLIARFRRARGDERLQLKWVAYAVVLMALALVYGAVVYITRGGGFGDALLPLDVATGTLPLAIGFAMLRYRLYDIDLIINRTLTYAAVTNLLAVGFIIISGVSNRVLEAMTGHRSELILLASVVPVALAFMPVRARALRVADRFVADRRVVTLLFLDVVQSTERAYELGDRSWRGLLERFRSTVRRCLRRHGGKEIDTAGDGFFVTFEAPGQALRCAREIVESVRPLGLQVRVGVHLGEVQVDGSHVTGAAVHLASRVVSEAGPDEVLASGALRDVVAGSDVEWRDRGFRHLKGVPGEVRLYAVY